MEKTCKNCAAVYWISERHIPFRDSDSIACECGEELYSWKKVSKDYTEKLKKHGSSFHLGATSRFVTHAPPAGTHSVLFELTVTRPPDLVATYLRTPEVIAGIEEVQAQLTHAAESPRVDAIDPDLLYTLKRIPGGEVLVTYYFRHSDDPPAIRRGA